jgi:hypothetical protein
MGTKQITRYEVREYVGSDYSKPLGQKLRGRSASLRIVRRLKKCGREVFASPMRLAA